MINVAHRLLAELQVGLLWRRTAAVSGLIVAIVLIADYVINVLLDPGVGHYTPFGTLTIVLLIAPPFVHALLLQTERAREAARRLAEEQATRATLEAINTARVRFLSNISNELRTPLDGIIGYTDLLLEDAEAEQRHEQIKDLRHIADFARRLHHMVNDLLGLTQIEAEKLALTVTDYSVRAVINDAVNVARVQAEQNRDVIDVHVEPGLEIARSDPFRLSQCLLNLLSNAAKFTKNGKIIVQARRQFEDGADWLVIEVRDTGVGIAPERQALLFEPFMQADAESGEGVGLGLPITRQLARLMGGDVSLRSTPGQGSCFTLRLPLTLDRGEPAQPRIRVAA